MQGFTMLYYPVWSTTPQINGGITYDVPTCPVHDQQGDEGLCRQ